MPMTRVIDEVAKISCLDQASPGSPDRPVIRIWHPDNPKLYVEIQFESQEAANTAVEQLNGMLKYATGLEFGEDAPS